MANGPRIFLFTSAGSGPPAWLRVWLIVAAVAVGAVLLWFGLVLALAVVLTVAVALLPVWVWRLFTAHRRPAAPATIDGEYTVTTISATDNRQEAHDRKPRGDGGNPYDHA